MAVRNFPKCEVGRSVVGPQYIHCSHVLLFATLGTYSARGVKIHRSTRIIATKDKLKLDKYL